MRIFGMIGRLHDYLKPIQHNMYEAGRYFLSHKAVVKRMKNGRKRK